MIDPTNGKDGVDAAAHIIQVALTPVFLLSGIGTLLSMFNLRQARVSDHIEHLSELLATEADAVRYARTLRHYARLRRRRVALDLAVLLAALGGASTCAAAFVLFLGGVRDAQIVTWLVVLFGGALGCVILGLMAFVFDSLMAWHGLRQDGPMPRPKDVVIAQGVTTPGSGVREAV